MSITKKECIKQIIESIQYIKHHLVASLGDMPYRLKKSEIPLTPSQWRVLHIIMENEPVSLKDIAKRLQISSSAATQLVDVLVSYGCVERKFSSEDRRALSLRITRTYKKDIQQLQTKVMEQLTRTFAHLNDRELQQYSTLNKKIVDYIHKEISSTDFPHLP